MPVSQYNQNLRHLFRKAEDYFFKSLSEKCLDLGGKKAYMTGVPFSYFNLVYLKSTHNLVNVLEQSKLFFSKANLPFNVDIPEELCTSEAQHILEEMGFLQIDKSVPMGLSLSKKIYTNLNELSDCIRIQQNNDLKDWVIPLKAFGADPEITLLYSNTHLKALERKFKLHHFCLYKDEQPVSSITLSIHDHSARIDDVATLAEFQNLGFGTCLIKHALSYAQQLGATHCFLDASDFGFSLYEKLGFTTIYKSNTYSHQ